MDEVIIHGFFLVEIFFIRGFTNKMKENNREILSAKLVHQILPFVNTRAEEKNFLNQLSTRFSVSYAGLHYNFRWQNMFWFKILIENMFEALARGIFFWL